MAQVHQDTAIWNLYKKEHLIHPQNVSQLMRWTQQTDNVKSLRFFEAKKIFKLRTIDNNQSMDIMQEKIELKEWIGDCKEEIVCLTSDALQMEDDYEESIEALQIKFDHLYKILINTKKQIISQKINKYNKINSMIISRQIRLKQTLNTLTKTLNECDIKYDKNEVQNVLTSIPHFSEINEYKSIKLNINPLKQMITQQLNQTLNIPSSSNVHHQPTKSLINFEQFSSLNLSNIDPDINDNDIKSNDNQLQPSPIAVTSPITPTTPILSPSLNLKISVHGSGSVGSGKISRKSSLKPSKIIQKKVKKKKKKMRRKDFQFIRVIGRGTFGKIILVKKKDDNSMYAMKVLKKTQIIAQEQEDNINTEIKVLKTLKHAFLMRAHYVFQTESKLYLVLDYYPCGDLMSHLKIKKRFSDNESQHIIAEVGLAIGALHGIGIVYRDLKPENILLDASGDICLCDFGLCKNLAVHKSTNTFCGTPDYLAPEILNRKSYNKSVDWWSYGILLFELIAGIVPFYSQSNIKMYQKIQNQILVFPSYVCDDCRDLICLLLNRDPLKRAGSKDDINEIRKHKWFNDIDWVKLYNKEIKAPYIPYNDNDNDDSSDEYYSDYGDTFKNQAKTPEPNLDKGLLANYSI